MRHILEHNHEWRAVLENALRSFEKRMCLILFTPLADKTTVIATNPGYGDVPDILFAISDLEELFNRYNITYTYDTFNTETQYNTETIIYLEKTMYNNE